MLKVKTIVRQAKGGVTVKKSVLLWVLACFCFFGTAEAANWTYVQRLEGTRFGACAEYVDADSVVRQGERIVYWTMWVVDDGEHPYPYKKLLWQNEVVMSKVWQQRSLRSYYYDKDEQEVFRYLQPGAFALLPMESARLQGVQRALAFAKDGTIDLAARPEHLLAAAPRWYGTVTDWAGELYWDVHSVIAWPPLDSEIIEIRTRWVWNELGAAARQAEVAALTIKPRPTLEGLHHTIIHYQFSLRENKVKVISAADYDQHQRRISLVDGGDWQAIAPGSREEMARRIALQWFDFQPEASASR